MLLLISLTLLVVIVIFLFFLLNHKKSSLYIKGRILFVTAHPDDECMFFAPTFLALKRSTGVQIHLLCLTDGNYCGQGSVRRQELYESVLHLGLLTCHVYVHSDERLPDDPAVEWDLNVVSSAISRAVSRLKIDTVITFDECGISGHPNHRAIGMALRHGLKTGRLVGQEPPPSVFLLETTSIFRKYLGLLDVPVSLLLSRYYTCCGVSDYSTARRAMACHKSQYVWFRKLYICFSRYLFVNTFRKVAP